MTARLRREGETALAAEDLVIGHLHMGGGPGLQHRVLPVADRRGHLARAVEISVKRMSRMLTDRTTHAGGRIKTASSTDPSDIALHQHWYCDWRRRRLSQRPQGKSGAQGGGDAGGYSPTEIPNESVHQHGLALTPSRVHTRCTQCRGT